MTVDNFAAFCWVNSQRTIFYSYVKFADGILKFLPLEKHGQMPKMTSLSNLSFLRLQPFPIWCLKHAQQGFSPRPRCSGEISHPQRLQKCVRETFLGVPEKAENRTGQDRWIGTASQVGTHLAVPANVSLGSEVSES